MSALPEFSLACDVVWDDDALDGMTDASVPLLSELHVRRLVAAALYEAGAEAGQLEFGVTFCAPERMRALNAEHRDVDAPTDVLAFPIDGLLEPVGPGEPRMVGDVLVCPAYVAAQVADGATMKPHGPGQEDGDATLDAALERCIVHGALHVAGFDHERSELDANEMFALEQLVLDRVRAAAGRSGP